ncbi:uncharacterized protein CIMG_13713 [Coccidioides immitis RS]|uniref:Uncharacterized protein n=1 Tax=Coccidioides immitis (strain RS) TaxID=246410 RepID=A0A0D8JX31_COCIM|nr:uncharacterized protein CIMG_13713 [Coccidioides immitis RS]KJF61496.1 hypothetical protein CIMG_13713 [Coccidioides immitis RS]
MPHRMESVCVTYITAKHNDGCISELPHVIGHDHATGVKTWFIRKESFGSAFNSGFAMDLGSTKDFSAL